MILNLAKQHSTLFWIMINDFLICQQEIWQDDKTKKFFFWFFSTPTLLWLIWKSLWFITIVRRKAPYYSKLCFVLIGWLFILLNVNSC